MAPEVKPVVGILSIGDMGCGIARVLLNHGFRVVTFAQDRSDRTRERAKSVGIELLISIDDLYNASDCLLSIVPPRDALGTARRICDAANGAQEREHPLYYVDLNAISPSLSLQLDNLFSAYQDIVFIDGGIIGGVPYPKLDSPTGWHCPSLAVSGPTRLPYEEVSELLRVDHLSPRVGAASGLKMCYASLTKGFFALAIESFVTADSLGVLGNLREYMRKYNAQSLAVAEKGVVSMPPKAYRWVNEMHQIGITMQESSGFSEEIFNGIAEVYRIVSEDTLLGLEEPGLRRRGTTVDDVVALIRSGMEEKANCTRPSNTDASG